MFASVSPNVGLTRQRRRRKIARSTAPGGFVRERANANFEVKFSCVSSNRLLIDQIRGVVNGAEARTGKAEHIAELIRRSGGYRWVGIYAVEGVEIAALGWSGPGEPAYPRFPVSKGLCGEAVRSRAPVVVGDVTKDPRYLTTFGSTRSEIIVPVVDPATRAALGVIDVESERLNAFADDDRKCLEECATLLVGLYA